MAQNIVNSSAYPLPTSPGLINNFLYTTHTAINGDQGDAKIDWNASEKDRFFGRYSQSLVDNPSTNNMPLFYNSFATYPTQNGVLDWVRTIQPHRRERCACWRELRTGQQRRGGKWSCQLPADRRPP